MTGTITAVANHGSIVAVVVEGEEGSRTIYMDHSPFRWMVDGEGGSVADDILGREVAVHGERFDDERIEFLDGGEEDE